MEKGGGQVLGVFQRWLSCIPVAERLLTTVAKEPPRCSEPKWLEASESQLGVCWLKILKLEEGGVLLDTHVQSLQHTDD